MVANKDLLILLVLATSIITSCNTGSKSKLLKATGQLTLSFANPYHNTYSKLEIELDNELFTETASWTEDSGPNSTVIQISDLEKTVDNDTLPNHKYVPRIAVPIVSNDSYKILIKRSHRSDSASIHYFDDKYVLESHSKEITFQQDTILKVPANNVWLFFRYCNDEDSSQIHDFERMIFTIGCVPYKMRPGNYSHFNIGADSLPINQEDPNCKITVKTYSYTGDISQLSRMQKSFNSWHEPTVRAYMRRWDGVVP